MSNILTICSESSLAKMLTSDFSLNIVLKQSTRRYILFVVQYKTDEQGTIIT